MQQVDAVKKQKSWTQEELHSLISMHGDNSNQAKLLAM